jgi:hypothetical protein
LNSHTALTYLARFICYFSEGYDEYMVERIIYPQQITAAYPVAAVGNYAAGAKFRA